MRQKKNKIGLILFKSFDKNITKITSVYSDRDGDSYIVTL